MISQIGHRPNNGSNLSTSTFTEHSAFSSLFNFSSVFEAPNKLICHSATRTALVSYSSIT